MSNCKHCNKPIETHTGRRPRQFCDEKCRYAYFNANKPKVSNMVRRETFEAVVAERDHYKAIVLNTPPTLPPEKTQEEKVNLEEEKKFSLPDAEIKAIHAQINTIRNEKIPSHRDTKLGRVSWQQEQWKRIAELEQKLQ